jgi:hypothetical protein
MHPGRDEAENALTQLWAGRVCVCPFSCCAVGRGHACMHVWRAGEMSGGVSWRRRWLCGCRQHPQRLAGCRPHAAWGCRALGCQGGRCPRHQGLARGRRAPPPCMGGACCVMCLLVCAGWWWCVLVDTSCMSSERAWGRGGGGARGGLGLLAVQQRGWGWWQGKGGRAAGTVCITCKSIRRRRGPQGRQAACCALPISCAYHWVLTTGGWWGVPKPKPPRAGAHHSTTATHAFPNSNRLSGSRSSGDGWLACPTPEPCCAGRLLSAAEWRRRGHALTVSA